MTGSGAAAWERISSRKNGAVLRLRRLGADPAFRRELGETVLDGEKLLREALASGCRVTELLAGEKRLPESTSPGARLFCAPEELVSYASPVKNSPGPVFTVAMERRPDTERLKNAIVLETVQDPGNIGTVLRTAKALGIDGVILTGSCADIYSPKAVRSSMGAIFRQRVIYARLGQLRQLAEGNGLKLYAAALSDRAEDIRRLDLKGAMVCVGSEGQGLSRELTELCDGEVIIPMEPGSESLNAAVAAAIIMWEMAR